MSEDLISTADAATRLSVAAAASAGEVTEHGQTLWVGSEEMSASIREISGSAQESATVARESVGLAGDMEGVMRTLSDSSSRIAEIVDVIASIAGQTNLLALNATISRVDGYQTAIAAAVEEQTATTNEMAQNVASAAAGSSRIFDSLGEVESTMGRTREAVDESSRATDDLGRTVSRLAELVGAFRV